MTVTRTYTRSFSGGEVTEEFFGQIGDTKFQTGLALAKNFWILPHGPIANRPGSKFVIPVKDSTKRTRVIDFVFSTTQTFCVEVGDQYFRFHTAGATLLNTAKNITNITQANPGVVTIATHGYANGKWLNLGDITGMVELNGRYVKVNNVSTNTFELQDTNGNNIDTTNFGAYSTGGTASEVFEVSSPYLEANLFDLHYVQSSDVLTLVHPLYAPRELRRLGATNWTLTTISFSPDLDAPDNVAVAATVATGSDFITHSYKITSIDSTGLEESAGSSVSQKTAVNVSGITKANPGVITTATHDLAIDDKVYVENIGGMVEILDGYYLVNTVPSATTITLKTLAGVPINTTGYTTYTSGGTVALVGIKNNLLTTGNYNTITWDAVADAERYNIYKESNGLYGYLGQAEGLTFKDDNITPDIGKTIPIQNDPFTGAGNYPAAASYYEQRRAFAGTINKPQNISLSRSGTESNMNYSIPTREDDAINFRIAARENNTIRHIVPLDNLLLMTSAAEFEVKSVNSDSLSPTSFSAKPKSYVGSSNVQPIIVDSNVLFASAKGGHIRELGYRLSADGLATTDLSLRAPHLFDNLEITDMAFAKAPYPILWATSSNGKLLGMTYIPDQEVTPWHQHDTDGLFESVCVVSEGQEDATYVVVQREIDGYDVRYIERFASRNFATLEDSYFVDAGVTYFQPITVTGVTQADPAVVTAVAHGLSNGDIIDARDFVGMTELNSQRYLVANKTNDTFELTDEDGNDIDSSAFTAYKSGGTIAKAVTSLSGLWWLEGKTVSILGNGAVFPQDEITAGALTFEQPVSKIHIGLSYNSDFQTLPMVLQAAAFAQGRVKNINEVWLRVYQSSGIFLGPSFDKLKEVKQRTTEPYGSPPALKSEEISLNLTPTWQANGSVCGRQSDPLPLTISNMTIEVALGA